MLACPHSILAYIHRKQPHLHPSRESHAHRRQCDHTVRAALCGESAWVSTSQHAHVPSDNSHASNLPCREQYRCGVATADLGCRRVTPLLALLVQFFLSTLRRLCAGHVLQCGMQARRLAEAS